MVKRTVAWHAPIPGIAAWLFLCVAMTVAGATSPASAQITPSTDEAAARGLIYPMQPYPQVQGLLGYGCAFADLDQDGDPDVIILGALDGHVGLFENTGGGFFVDRSATSGLPVLDQGAAVAAGDYDSDGDLDLYLTQLGLPNVLARNEGGFVFTDVAATALVDDDGPGQAACFGDYDNDGLLDLYVCNYNGALPGTADHDNKLYRNLGDGTFEEVSVAQTVDDFGLTFQAVWFDFDRDGDVDLYTSNDRGHQKPLFRTNQLWRNDDGQLVNISEDSGADVGLFSMGVACGDFDGNGFPDLYCTNVAGYAEGYNPLLLNFGGTFIEASAAFGVDSWVTSWGSIFYDFDHSGHLDLYVNNMFQGNKLFSNGGAPPCAEIAVFANVQGAPGGTSFSSAVADVDGDGDLDLLVNDLGPNGQPLNVQLFINHEGTERRWVRYRMIGDGLNRHAIGGAVDSRFGNAWQLREVLAGGNGYLGQNELVLHVGAGTALVVDEVVARWPSGGPSRTLTNLPTNQTWAIYPPARLGDDDGDGQVVLDDFLAFAACFGAPLQPGCEVMDLDGNSIVDWDDWPAFLAVYTGPLDDCDANGQLDLEQILLDPGLDADNDGALDACQCPADLTGDGQVNIVDLLQLLTSWGTCPGCPADLDGNGTVNTVDLLAMLAAWGACG